MTKESSKKLISAYIRRYATNQIGLEARLIYDLKGIKEATLNVRNEIDFEVHGLSGEYRVSLGLDKNKSIYTLCNCAKVGKVCAHQVAALYQAIDLDALKVLLDDNKYNPGNQECYLDNTDPKIMPFFLPFALKEKVYDLVDEDKVQLNKLKNGKASFQVRDGRKSHKVSLQRIKNDPMIKTSCTCNDGRHILCAHKLAALFFLSGEYGNFAFEESMDWKGDMKEILGRYGYTLEDYPRDMFKFTFEEGALILAEEPDVLNAEVVDSFKGFEPANQVIQNMPEQVGQNKEGIVPAFVFEVNKITHNFNVISVYPASGQLRKNKKRHKGMLEVAKNDNKKVFQINDLSYDGFQLIQQLENYKKSVNPLFEQAFPDDMEFYEDREIVIDLWDEQPFVRNTMAFLHDVAPKLQSEYCYLLPEASSLSRINVSNFEQFHFKLDKFLEAKLSVGGTNNAIEVKYSVSLGEEVLEEDMTALMPIPWIFITEGEAYLWKDHYHFLLASFFGFETKTHMMVPPKEWLKIFEGLIQKIQNQIPVNMEESMHPKERQVEPNTSIKLSETGNFLLFSPIIDYNGHEVQFSEKGEQIVYLDDGQIVVVPRDKDYEEKAREFVAGLHPAFNKVSEQDYFFLPADKVMENMWFFDFYEQCQNEGIAVYGLKTLKKVKYNPNRPNATFNVSSGTDWFDIKLDVKFGQQAATLKDVKKALGNNQNYVKLGDGTWGLLPEEWLEKWSELMKFGKIQGKTLKVSKLHFQYINKLYNELDNEKLLQELDEKKALLQSFEKIEKAGIPKQLNAQMREYQEAGLSWLVFLTQYKWGGILADDMGLGKTIQMLALFLYFKEHHPRKKQVFLVVSPTTLLFNWENEILKFAPGLSYTTHWGPQRSGDTSVWKDYDIILTTYGTLARDIGWIKDFSFTIAVLDESQAIKNPASQRFKAVNLLSAQYRFTMTGTPIENNTMELYAQMHFVNPGLLGTQNFFRTEYANPVDKEKDPEQTAALKQLIKPFLLRRTKERVAKELPPKTEIPLFCEMGKEQRSVYEAFKNTYREKLLSQIDEDGLNKTRFQVLDALLKLRQICDSPAILNTEDDYGSESVKIDELVRHIREKTGKHKVLVFSQFVRMLSLVREQLDEGGFKYSYLDGSTRNRREAVECFQQDNDIRIMLISLKAGSFGLNLTEADYIFLIDPWWNPAIEQQAIDRTHRIGQDKHVFAYKMICKNSVEEKILDLQNRKKTLAQDLIGAEEAFVKNLTEDDIRAILE